MRKQQNNFAYIDGSNLHKGISDLGWGLDYKKFRVWLKEKYNIEKAFIFLGLVPKYADLYNFLQNCGFELIFKPTVPDGDGKLKGNCDAELVLQTVCDFYESKFDNAIIVSGDGDFACLVKFLQEKRKLKSVLSPEHKKCSVLLKRLGVKITFLEEFRSFLSVK